jgi:acyltransferase
MKKERVHWGDIARGIGIIFIIYGHLIGGHGFRYILYSFHIPLFFFLSGFVYNHQKYQNFFNFLKRTVKGILVPYFIFAFICFAIWLSGLKNPNIFSSEVTKQFLSIFYGNSNDGLMVFNNILWFLPALFVTKILFAVIIKLTVKTKPLIFIMILFSIFGYLFSIIASHIHLPFSTEASFSAVVFYGAGFLWNRSEKAKSFLFQNKYLLFFPLLIIGIIISTVDFHMYGHQIDIRLSHLNNYFFFYIAAFCGIFAWISFSLILNKNRLLEIIGKNSLILFAWHLILFAYINNFLNIVFGSSLLSKISGFMPIVYAMLSIIIIIYANLFYNYLKLAYHRILQIVV